MTSPTVAVYVEAPDGRRALLAPVDPDWPEDWHATCACGWDSENSHGYRADMPAAYGEAANHLGDGGCRR